MFWALSIIAPANAEPVSGEELFQKYCSLCHGATGLGDGRLSRVIAEPPPANLVESNKPKAYLRLIVQRGGKAMGRSEKMPPWEAELGKDGVDAVVEYAYKLRQSKAR